jgi:tRNA uridine 5-carbamoylmethylation protein Kti12
MAVLVIMRGLPGAGKTTRARAWVAEDHTSRARVNRDDLRAMMHAGVWRGSETEGQILAARGALITALLRGGVDVVCDDTNLPAAAVRDLAKLGAASAATFEVWDMTDVPLDICVERDRQRERPVGERRIADLYRRHLAGRGYPLPLPRLPRMCTVE